MSQNKRRRMYAEIVKQIGPHRDWDEKIRPLQKRREYDQLLSKLAEEFEGEPTALQQQINFATTTQWGLTNQSHIKSFILNKSAALETGFILTNELPNHLTAN